MIPRLVVGTVRGEVIPRALWIGVRAASGRQWCKRIRVIRRKFVFFARLRGVYHAFLEAEPLGKGRRKIGEFTLPGNAFPLLKCDLRALQVQITGEPKVEAHEEDSIGLADARWNRSGQWIREEPITELDRTYESDGQGYDRVYLYRKNRGEIAWWPIDKTAEKVALDYAVATLEPVPQSSFASIAEHLESAESTQGEQDGSATQSCS